MKTKTVHVSIDVEVHDDADLCKQSIIQEMFDNDKLNHKNVASFEITDIDEEEWDEDCYQKFFEAVRERHFEEFKKEAALSMKNERKVVSLKLRGDELLAIEKRWQEFVKKSGLNVSRHWFIKSLVLGTHVHRMRVA